MTAGLECYSRGDSRAVACAAGRARAPDPPAANVYGRRREIVELDELIIATIGTTSAEFTDDNC